METSSDFECPSADEEQLLYAKILQVGMYSGLALLLLTFALYTSGIVEPAVPVEQLPAYWTMSGIALLSTITIVCYAGIVPTLIRKKDKVYATLALVEIAILTLAASGILTAGH